MQNSIEQFLNYIRVERGFSIRTVQAYRHDLTKFVEFIRASGKITAAEITKEDIRQFLSNLAQDGYKKPNVEITRARKLSSIKSFCKFLVQEHIFTKDTDPASDIQAPKIPYREPAYLSTDEYNKLLLTIKTVATPYYQLRDMAVVTLLLGTGIRLSELVGLTLNSIELKECGIKVIGKGNKERRIPLSPDVVSKVAKYIDTRPEVESNALFISRKGSNLSSGSVYHLVKGYLKAAGIKKEKVGVHSLRHTFGASLLNTGANVVVIQELLGHKSLETTRRYLHFNKEDLQKAVNQIVFK